MATKEADKSQRRDIDAALGAGFEGAEVIPAQESDAILHDPTLVEEFNAAERKRKRKEREQHETKAVEENATVAESWEDIPDDDLPTEWCYVPEWGTKHLMQAMSREARDGLERDFTKVDPDNPEETQIERMGFVSAVVALTWVHPTERDPKTGERKRIIVGPEARARLQKKNAEAVSRLYDVGARLSGLRKVDRDNIKGNSASDRGDTSSIASPSTGSA